jgi:hypothetical protein
MLSSRMRSIVAFLTIAKGLSFPIIGHPRQFYEVVSSCFLQPFAYAGSVSSMSSSTTTKSVTPMSLFTTTARSISISNHPMAEIERRRRNVSFSFPLQMAKPKSGSIVDGYQTVSVNCAKCRTRLFRYKKKNGTKSNLVKCYIERISEDCVNLIEKKRKAKDDTSVGGDEWFCPTCQSRFGKDSMIHGRPAIKLVGGKIQMTKK